MLLICQCDSSGNRKGWKWNYGFLLDKFTLARLNSSRVQNLYKKCHFYSKKIMRKYNSKAYLMPIYSYKKTMNSRTLKQKSTKNISNYIIIMGIIFFSTTISALDNNLQESECI